MRRSAGVTLSEMIIVCTLLLVVQFVAYDLLVLCTKTWSVAGARASVTINAQIGLEAMRRDMMDSISTSFTSSNSKSAVSFLTANDTLGRFVTDGSGSPTWQAWLIYYVDSSKVLRKRRVASTSTSALSQDKLNGYCDGSGMVIAYDVSTISTAVSGTQVTVVLTSLATSKTGNETLTPRTTFSLQN